MYATTRILVLALLLALAPLAARAELYLIAKRDAIASISGTAASPHGIFLMWDVTEGSLPAGLQGFVLRRGDLAEPVATISLNPMTPGDIDLLYVPAEQSRRHAQILAWLGERIPGMDPQDLGQEIAALIGPVGDAAWTTYGARLDFNIALARGHAYLDTEAPPGDVEYELLGDLGGGDLVVLGHVEVDNDAPQVLPAPEDLSQPATARCDAPESGGEDGVLALNWDHAGEQIDQLSHSLAIAGYDIYCTTASVPSGWTTANLPDRDLRAEAAVLGHDAQGRVAFAELQPINERPVAISGEGETNPSNVDAEAAEPEPYQGYQHPFVQYELAPEKVAALGMQRGESYGCYVVPLDFTGSYGETAKLKVDIPDAFGPPPPWAIETITDTPGDQLILSFDHVDVVNYHRKHRQDRVYCNLEDAQAEGELRFVRPGESCDEARQTRVPLEVERYLVYRFDDFNEARNFVDTDGDGVADPYERVLADNPIANPGVPICDLVAPGDECLTLPGTACDPGAQSPGPDHSFAELTPQMHLISRPSGRSVIEAGVPVGPGDTGRVLWYRIASVGPDGQIGELSAPLRTLIPRRDRPTLDELYDCEPSLDERFCAASVQTTSHSVSGSQIFAIDETPDHRAAWLRLTCTDDTGVERVHRVVPIDGQTGTVESAPGGCEAVQTLCAGGDLEVDFLAPDGSEIAGTSLHPNECPSFVSELREDQPCFTTGRQIYPGDTAQHPLDLTCIGTEHCLVIFREVDGEDHRLATICPDDPPACFDGFLIDQSGQLVEAECPGGVTRIPLPNLDGGPVCLSVALADDNNLQSTRYNLPCVRTAARRPGRPNPLDLAFPGAPDETELTWLPSEDRIVGTYVELRVRGDDRIASAFFEHGGASANDGPLTRTLESDFAPPVGEEEQEWCFRARSVGASHPGRARRALSDWSPELCVVRGADGPVAPDELGWPAIADPPERDALQARYLNPDGIPLVRLTGASSCLNLPPCEQVSGRPWESGWSCFPETTPNGQPLGLDAALMFGSAYHCPVCPTFEADLAPFLGFVAYRQERAMAGAPASDWAQVSPLIEYQYCTPTFIRDPWIKTLRFPEPDGWAGDQHVWADRYPHSPDVQLRWLFVYFNALGEIQSYRTSNWVTVP